MKLYHFSPILTEEELIHVTAYVVSLATDMCEKTIGKALTIFAHYPEEFKALKKYSSS